MVVWCGWGVFRAGGANRGTDTIFGPRAGQAGHAGQKSGCVNIVSVPISGRRSQRRFPDQRSGGSGGSKVLAPKHRVCPHIWFRADYKGITSKAAPWSLHCARPEKQILTK